jgi:PfpI family intracellular protease
MCEEENMKALIISADLFEDCELKIPYQFLRELGIDVDITSMNKGAIQGKHGFNVYPTITLNEVEPEQYDILILPGGKGPSLIRKDLKALEISRYFFDHNKLVAAICHGPQILISAGLMKGRVATGYPSIADELKEAGAIYKDEEVVVDNNLITSRQPSDLHAFMNAIKEYLYHESKR